MKKTDGPLTALRPRPITIDQPLPIFWGSKPPDDAIDYEAAPRKTKSKPEISPIPNWSMIKGYKTETKGGFTLPAKYISQPFDDSQIEYELDEQDEDFLEELATRKFYTDSGNPFQVSLDLVRLTIDYLEKFAFRQEKQCHSPYNFEGNDLRKKIELLNGCVLPKSVYTKIVDYWKRKRNQNGNQPLIESLIEEEIRRQEIEREATKQRIKKMQADYDELWILRKEFERIRMLFDTIKKREKIKSLLTTEYLYSIEDQVPLLPALRKEEHIDIDLTDEPDRPIKKARTEINHLNNSAKKTQAIHTPLSPKKRMTIESSSDSEELGPPTKVAKTSANSSPRVSKIGPTTRFNKNASPSKISLTKSPPTSKSSASPTKVKERSPTKKGRISKAEIEELNKVNRVLKDKPSPLNNQKRMRVYTEK